MRDRYDDGGFSGGSMERPALKKLPAAARSAATGAAVPLASRPDVPIPHRNVLCWTVVSNKALSDCERSRASWVGTAER